MLIRKLILLVPVILAINAYGNDSASYYLGLGKELLDNNQLEISEKYFRKAIHFSTDTTITVNSLIYLGISLKKLGKYNLAIACYQKADSISHDPETKASLYINMALVYVINGDYSKALAYYSKALDLSKWPDNLARVYNNMAIVYYNQGDALKALGFYKKSMALKLAYSPQSLSSVYLNMALCYEKLDSVKLAGYYFKKTIKEQIQLYGGKHPVLIMSYLNYGNFLIKTNPEKSLSLLVKANKLAITNYGNKHVETAQTFICMGNYFANKKDYYQALNNYQKALISNNKSFESWDFYRNPGLKDAISGLDQVEILHQKAIAFQKYAATLKNQDKELKISLATYELAIETLFRLQNSFMDESKRTLIAEKKDMFAEAAYIGIQLGDYSKAFRLIEKGKASTLLEAVNNNEAIKFSNIPDSLVKLENEYKRLQFVYAANDVTDSVLFYQAKYDNLVSYFETHYKKYYNLKYGNDFTNPCEHLDTNQVLLEYALTDTLCITLVVTKEGYKHYSFPVDSTFNENTEAFVKHLRKFDYDKDYKEQYNIITSCGYYLWQKLIKPLHIPEGKSLIIVPDGILSYLNFETLLYEPKDDPNMNYYLLKYLLYKHPISYSYSSLWLFEPYNESPDKSIIAFAADYKDKDNLMILLHAVDEVKKITSFFRGKPYINERCTKEAFLVNAPDYRIIHMALHGDIDKKNPDNSMIAFYDDNLYSWEVYGMNLKAQMAYLGACKTGDGILDKGEGVFSMGRAFAYAGCPTVIMSLWADKDNLSHITLDFYKYLRKGYSLDKAMQQAKINHLKQKFDSHPHFWSNKIVMGKTKPINKQYNYWLIALFIIPIYVLYVKVIKK